MDPWTKGPVNGDESIAGKRDWGRPYWLTMTDPFALDTSLSALPGLAHVRLKQLKEVGITRKLAQKGKILCLRSHT